MELDGKTAIVTGAGGAGVGGLGVVFAEALADAGAAVVVVDIDREAAEEVASRIVDKGHRALGVAADVADEEQVTAMVDAACREFSGVDILVNNAGLARGKWSEGLELGAEDWMRIFAVNSLSPLLCARACRPSMVARGGGAIINLASSAAYMETGAYSVTKLAVVGMTQMMATELGSENIRVNAIAPGMMTAKIPEELIRQQLALQRLSRQGRPEDLTGALLYLASPHSSFMTGQTLLVDGGTIRGRI
ncbi:glucose 1-dehydrogenase [Rhodococcus sp. IEGM 1366]|uniref:SDR family NAD(P)-dependent oxidoreductase n=1 Tax=Rhodococcus sp. IEGM 1366 TaxID=3082223 RepID=UPI002953E7B7|nr:glucose 1-dehydrogenase [Rhodococcus sp. IEGM 1366]MDV8070993.1 glucose 1-dehydrogenase [Rhodococcus sp. IEGM 1366]